MMSLRDEEEQTRRLLAPTPEHLASVKVFPLIPSIKRDATINIDSALSWDQLTASDINFAIVRPLVFKYAKLDNMAVVYACFVVRSYFITEAEENLAYAGVLLSRAALCEILAMKLLGRFASCEIQLAAVLTASWNPLAGAPDDIQNEVIEEVGTIEIDPQCALEMAIATEAKHFISSPLVQAVVNDIYNGRVVFSMTSHHSVLADNYKPRAIEFYNVHKAPFLDHYRLRVPKYAATLEFFNFVILLLLFLLALSDKNMDAITPFEIVFIAYASAFALAEYTASKEHGWGIYIASIWNVFDTAFIMISTAYVILRIKGLVQHDHSASDLAFDILACGACVLFPRLAFFAVKNNVVVLALRAMATDFIFFIGIAVICFSGLLFTLHSLAEEKWTVKAIAWLMVQIWFGNTYLSFAQAKSFHPVFGPLLMTCFAALSNTLLLTILISILSNTFARIDANASREYLFQYAIVTIEGVKSDALFSYQPPFNLLAFLILWPLSCVLTPRGLHTANVFLIRLTSFPVLIIIGAYERFLAKGRKLRMPGSELYNSLTQKVKHVPFLERLVGSTSADLYDAIFHVDLPDDLGLFEELDQEEADRPRLISEIAPDVLRPISPPASGPSTMRRAHSADPSRAQTLSPNVQVIRSRAQTQGPWNSPRRRRMRLPSEIRPAALGVGSTEVQTAPQSPLTQLFAPRREVSATHEKVAFPSGAPDAEGMKRLEALVQDIKELPVNRLKDEMKELQDRQSRIENLLLMLTRGMRNEATPHGSFRHDTM